MIPTIGFWTLRTTNLLKSGSLYTRNNWLIHHWLLELLYQSKDSLSLSTLSFLSTILWLAILYSQVYHFVWACWQIQTDYWPLSYGNPIFLVLHHFVKLFVNNDTIAVVRYQGTRLFWNYYQYGLLFVMIQYQYYNCWCWFGYLDWNMLS